MKLEYGRDGIPAMVIEKPDARIRITFNETSKETPPKISFARQELTVVL